MGKELETAVFGGGCFWCTEAVFRMLKGVVSVMPGYAGGKAENPTYEHVSTGTTGHAEVIKIEYDPQEISFRDLLTVFFATHDPTTPNRQGNDVGPQYRSIILYASESQKAQAEAFVAMVNNSTQEGAPVVTELQPLGKFYDAEAYRRQYYEKNQDKPYCQVVINPKIRKVQEKFAELLKEKSVERL